MARSVPDLHVNPAAWVVRINISTEVWIQYVRNWVRNNFRFRLVILSHCLLGILVKSIVTVSIDYWCFSTALITNNNYFYLRLLFPELILSLRSFLSLTILSVVVLGEEPLWKYIFFVGHRVLSRYLLIYCRSLYCCLIRNISATLLFKVKWILFSQLID